MHEPPSSDTMIRPLFAITALCALPLSTPIKADEAGAESFKKSYKKGKNYYGFCMFCHGRDGKGTRLDEGGTMTPPLAGSPRVLGPKEVSANILLHGLTGKVDGVIYEKAGVAMKPPPEMMGKDDEIIAGLLNYIRNSWGNKAPIITPADVKAIRKETKGREKPWTIEELAKTFPWKEKASEDEK